MQKENESEFAEFYEAMNIEYERHRPRKGDSWKSDVATIGRMWPTHADYSEGAQGIPITKSMDEYLHELLEKAFRETKEPHQLVDISLVCAMIWTRNRIDRILASTTVINGTPF